MPKHSDFEKIYSRFTAQYKEKGESMYFAWLNKHGYDDAKPFPKKDKTEKKCIVKGIEFKEEGVTFHVGGLIATSHIDLVDDYIPKETLDSFANQINTNFESRVMGVHHSEGITNEYFGEADVSSNPAKVIPLTDGQYGLYVDTKMLMDDPKVPEIINQVKNGDLNAFSITYDTNGFMTTDFDWVGDKLVRVLNPETRLFGYTLASMPVNPEAVAVEMGFKEFKELLKPVPVHVPKIEVKEKVKEDIRMDATTTISESEMKEYLRFKSEKEDEKRRAELKEEILKITTDVIGKSEMKEKVMRNEIAPGTVEVSMELKEFREMLEKPAEVELKEQFRRADALANKLNLWERPTSKVEKREFKHFSIGGKRGTKFEFKGLGITTNQNTDTDYLQSTAELQDVYDPVIYNALNQSTIGWNLLSKDDFSSKGNNKVQFVLKIAANETAVFYTGNAVTTGVGSRKKYETQFKKIQAGISIDGDMIAAARGSQHADLFGLEVQSATEDMLAVINAAIYGVTGTETSSGIIGMGYIADSSTYTSLYNVTRSTTNKLAPDSAADTYINQSSATISMANLRKMKRQAVTEGAKKANLVYMTSPTQGDILRGKFDDTLRRLSPRDTGLGFETDLFIDGIPVFEDKDITSSLWFCVDLESHRVGVWVPPTIEMLGKLGDYTGAFIKMYFAIYNLRPRALGCVYGCATS